MNLITEPYLDPERPLARFRPPHPRPVRRRVGRRLPGVQPGDQPLRRPARLLRRRLQHGPDDLDQAELPLDDVPLGLGHQGEPGSHARRPAAAGRLRRDPAPGGPFVLRPRGLRERRGWRRAVAGSDVRLQWDPDHGPSGNPVERRAIQLGLRGDVLARYAKEWLLEIEDISEFVASSGRMRWPDTSGWSRRGKTSTRWPTPRSPHGWGCRSGLTSLDGHEPGSLDQMVPHALNAEWWISGS